LENKVKALRIEFYSDTTMQRADKDAVPGIYRRVRNIAYEQSRSTSAPTQTQRDAYAIAADRFEPALARLKAIASEDVVRIEKRLEGLGAPYTPGRLPVWKKN
jgi:hypothetical protein